MQITLPDDPAPSEDGRCARAGCGKERTEAAVKERDPFCSTTCCRLHHDIPIPDGAGGYSVRSRGYVSKD